MRYSQERQLTQEIKDIAGALTSTHPEESEVTVRHVSHSGNISASGQSSGSASKP
jgi:hypothetical protein